MAKKKARGDSPTNDNAGPFVPPMTSASASSAQVPKSKTPRSQPSTSALIICRNKYVDVAFLFRPATHIPMTLAFKSYSLYHWMLLLLKFPAVSCLDKSNVSLNMR